MKLWVDDVRPAPTGYRWAKSTNEAIEIIRDFERYKALNRLAPDAEIELIDLDHDAGDCANDGGDFIKILEWLEDEGAIYDIRLHTMNPVGRQNMRAIIQHNGWKEIL